MSNVTRNCIVYLEFPQPWQNGTPYYTLQDAEKMNTAEDEEEVELSPTNQFQNILQEGGTQH